MLMLKGEIKSVNKKKVRNKKGKETEFTVLQVLSNGGDFVRLLDVVDYENQEWSEGETEIPVRVSAYQAKSGNVGINYIVV